MGRLGPMFLGALAGSIYQNMGIHGGCIGAGKVAFRAE